MENKRKFRIGKEVYRIAVLRSWIRRIRTVLPDSDQDLNMNLAHFPHPSSLTHHISNPSSLFPPCSPPPPSHLLHLPSSLAPHPSHLLPHQSVVTHPLYSLTTCTHHPSPLLPHTSSLLPLPSSLNKKNLDPDPNVDTCTYQHKK